MLRVVNILHLFQKDQTRRGRKTTRLGQTPDRRSMEMTRRRIMKRNVTTDRMPKIPFTQKKVSGQRKLKDKLKCPNNWRKNVKV